MTIRILLALLATSLLSVSCSAQEEYGQFTKAECPIKISKELASGENFTFGYITVPEFHKKPGSQAIELAVAIFKCRADAPKYDPLFLNSGGPGMSNKEFLDNPQQAPDTLCVEGFRNKREYILP